MHVQFEVRVERESGRPVRSSAPMPTEHDEHTRRAGAGRCAGTRKAWRMPGAACTRAARGARQAGPWDRAVAIAHRCAPWRWRGRTAGVARSGSAQAAERCVRCRTVRNGVLPHAVSRCSSVPKLLVPPVDGHLQGSAGTVTPFRLFFAPGRATPVSPTAEPGSGPPSSYGRCRFVTGGPGSSFSCVCRWSPPRCWKHREAFPRRGAGDRCSGAIRRA